MLLTLVISIGSFDNSNYQRSEEISLGSQKKMKRHRKKMVIMYIWIFGVICFWLYYLMYLEFPMYLNNLLKLGV